MESDRRRALIVTLALAVVLCAAATARAQDIADVEVARRHYQAGATLYEARRYREAIEKFEQAKRYKPLAAFDYNIARAWEELGEAAAAVAAYERFLAAAPPGAEVDDARDRAEALRKRIAAEVVGARPRPTGNRYSAPAIALGTITLAALAIGTGLIASVAVDYRNEHAECELHQCAPSDWQYLERRADGGYAALGVAAAAAAVDVALLVLWARERRHRVSPRAAAELVTP